MGTYAGSIRINVKVDPSGTSKSFSKIKADMTSLAAAARNMNAQIGQALSSVGQSIASKSGIQIDDLKKRLAGLSKTAKDAQKKVTAAALKFGGNSIKKLGDYLKRTQFGFTNLSGAARKAQQKITASMSRSEKSVASLLSKLAILAAAFGSIVKVASISDDFSLTNARIDQMNDGLQTSDELIEMIYQSAQRARGSFDGMASVVARFGNNARDAFSSAKEVVDFSELIQKQMVIAGAGTEEAKNAMIQLSQAMGSGVLRGDELNSIFEQAPNLIRTIADYMDLSIGDVRAVAAEGKITADIIKKAVFANAKKINAQFEQMPKTWGQAITGFKNTALMSFRPVLSALNNLANSTAFQKMETAIVSGLDNIANACARVINLVAIVDVSNSLNLKDDGMKSAAKGTAQYAASLGKVSEAAKTAKSNLAGFDDLDVLGSNEAAGSGSDFSETVENAEKAADAMGELTDAVEDAGEAIEESIGKKAAGVINRVFADTDFEKGANVMMRGLDLISAAVYDFSTAVRWEYIGENFRDGLNGLFVPSSWAKAGKAGGKLIDGLFTTLYATASGLDYRQLGEAIADLLVAASEEVDVSKLSGAIGSFVTGYFTVIGTVLSDKDAQEQLSETITEFFTGLFENLDPETIGSAIGLLFHVAMTSLRDIIGEMDPSIISDGLKAMISQMDFADVMTLMGLLFVTKGIPMLLGAIGGAMPGMLSTLFGSLKTLLSGHLGGLISETILPWISGTAIPKVMGALSGLGSSLYAVLVANPIGLAVLLVAGIIALFVGFKDEYVKIFTEAGQTIAEVFDWVKDRVCDIFDWISEKVSDVIDLVKGLKNFKLDIFGDDDKPRGGGTSGGWLNVPRYADGAVIRGGDPYLAIVGDQPSGQTNVETPLNTMLEAFRQALDDWNPRGGGGTVILELDGRELARGEIDYIKEELTRRGISFT